MNSSDSIDEALTEINCVRLFETNSKQKAPPLSSQASTSHVGAAEKETARLDEKEIHSLLTVPKSKLFRTIKIQKPICSSLFNWNSPKVFPASLKSLLSIPKVFEILLSYLTYEQLVDYRPVVPMLTCEKYRPLVKRAVVRLLLSVYLDFIHTRAI